METLEEELDKLEYEFKSALHWGIITKPSVKRGECEHRRIATRLINSSGNKNGDLDYLMPYCEDCGECFPSRGSYRCVLLPIMENVEVSKLSSK